MKMTLIKEGIGMTSVKTTDTKRMAGAVVR